MYVERGALAITAMRLELQRTVSDQRSESLQSRKGRARVRSARSSRVQHCARLQNLLFAAGFLGIEARSWIKAPGRGTRGCLKALNGLSSKRRDVLLPTPQED